MSGSNTSSSEDLSDNVTTNPQGRDLTNSALGEGQLSGRDVGTSTPLPYSPHEKGAVDGGQASAANQGTYSLQHKSSSATRLAMEQNTLSPRNTVQPPHSIAVEREPGQGYSSGYGPYVAWASTARHRESTISPQRRSVQPRKKEA